MNYVKRLILIILFLTGAIFIASADTTSDNPAKRLLLDKTKQNIFFDLVCNSNLSLNSTGQLMYIKAPEDQPGDVSNDRFFPLLDLRLQVACHYPVNKQFAVGPSLFNQTVVKLFHHTDDTAYAHSVQATVNSVILPGVSFVITPWLDKLDMPVAYIQIDAGPAFEINNNEEDGDGLYAKIGGFTNQLIILPIMPIHLFIMDINVLAFLAVNTPLGWYPGIRVRNYCTVKFGVFNFIHKSARSGIRLYNVFSFVLTGQPSLTDFTSQYTYNKLYLTMYWGAIPGLEIHLGYAFESITFARDSLYHFAHKLISEIKWERKNFSVKFRYTLEFWDITAPQSQSIRMADPVNKFDLSIGYSWNRMSQ